MSRQAGNVLFGLLTAVAFLALMVYVVGPAEGIYKTRRSRDTCAFCVVKTFGAYHFVLVEGKHLRNSDAIKTSARKLCHGYRPACVVMIWRNREQTPMQLPLSPAHITSEALRYQINWTTGAESLCRVKGGQVDPQGCT